MSLRYKRLYLDSPELEAPRNGDAGYDLRAYGDYILNPYRPTVINTGITLEIPAGYVGLVLPRSGLRFKYGVTVFGTGVIDSAFRGELKALLTVSPTTPDALGYKISNGDKISQLVIVPYFSEGVEEVSELSLTIRGTDGFGSTGR